MLIVDLLKPKLDWDTEYAVLKQNNNKIFQYVFTVFIILLLIYLNYFLYTLRFFSLHLHTKYYDI